MVGTALCAFAPPTAAEAYAARASYAYMNSMLFDPSGNSHFII